MSHAAQRRRAATLERITEEALHLVAVAGLEGLTMARLAKRVDYTAPALYRYFPSKGALIAELNRHILVEHRARLDAAWSASRDPVDALEKAAAVLVAHAAERPEAFGVVALTLADPRRLVHDEVPAHLPEMLGLVGDLTQRLDAAIASGAHRPGDPQQRAVRWLFGLFGTLQLTKLAQFDPRLSPEPFTLGLARDLLRAWSQGDAP